MEISSLELIKIDNTVKAVIFDCFGTLMQTTARKKPYKYLIQYLKTQDYSNDQFACWLMTNNILLKDIEKYTNIVIPENIKQQFESDLEADLLSIKLYNDTKDTIENLKTKKIKTMLCSNLALPYGNVAKTLINVDHYILSYECGFLKPNKAIYHYCQDKVMLNRDEIIFVGDNYKDDYEGATNFGFKSYWLNRIDKIPT